MVTFDKSDFQRFATASVGALLLSAACIVGAVAPARAAERNAPLTVQDWKMDVERQIDATLRTPSLEGRDHAAATVAIHFDADGKADTIAISKSSGIASADAEALRTANRVAYPALPSGLRGRPQTIAMMVYFGAADTAADRKAVAAMQALAEQRAEKTATLSAALPTS
ncbi:energy transducer TonB family protein [Flavisphingomonas formosensis]|uniref:energy transducer TonB family protein n=1 Tax=Flavisphingomonas formosensis TaxID=861534 RepID=UPI0012FAFE81|nr:TonB family protein [Sphingomonas formosensis]